MSAHCSNIRVMITLGGGVLEFRRINFTAYVTNGSNGHTDLKI